MSVPNEKSPPSVPLSQTAFVSFHQSQILLAVPGSCLNCSACLLVSYPLLATWSESLLRHRGMSCKSTWSRPPALNLPNHWDHMAATTNCWAQTGLKTKHWLKDQTTNPQSVLDLFGDYCWGPAALIPSCGAEAGTLFHRAKVGTLLHWAQAERVFHCAEAGTLSQCAQQTETTNHWYLRALARALSAPAPAPPSPQAASRGLKTKPF